MQPTAGPELAEGLVQARDAEFRSSARRRTDTESHSFATIRYIKLEVGTKKTGASICGTSGSHAASFRICSINAGDSIQKPSASTSFTMPAKTPALLTNRKTTCL